MEDEDPLEKHKQQVIIIGGGPTGLLIAHGLQRAGIPFAVYEKQAANKLRKRDWGMALHWGIPYLKACLPDEFAERLIQAEVDEFGMGGTARYEICNGETGEILLVPPKGEDKTLRVSRRKLATLLSEGIDIQYGKALQHIQADKDSVEARFDDGSSVSGSMLVGTDGARSAVRNLLLGPELAAINDLPAVTFTATVHLSPYIIAALQGHDSITKYGLHPRSNDNCLLCLLDVTDPEVPESWEFMVMYKTWLGGAASASDVRSSEDFQALSELTQSNFQRREYLRQRAEEWVEPWKSALLSISDTTEIYRDVVTSWVSPSPWNNSSGRVTLAGDAAHPMTPYRGQGLNNSAADAAAYIEAVRSVYGKETRAHEAANKIANGTPVSTLAETICAYDREVFARGMTETAMSARQMYAMHNFDAFKESPLVRLFLRRAEPETKTGEESVHEESQL